MTCRRMRATALRAPVTGHVRLRDDQMLSLRFANPDLHSQFLEGLKSLPFAVEKADDGTVICTDEQWPEVNSVAHRVRDGCFKWYFSWCNTRSGAEALEEHLRANGLRFELEHHENRVVFLLPRSDRDKHTPPSDPGTGPSTCSFCGGSYTERQRFFATEAAAICDECIGWLYAEVQADRPA